MTPPALCPPAQEEQQAAASGRIAIIADEAHRAHGHSTSEQMHRLLGAAAGGSQPRHLSYFGFTATPGAKALTMFGVAQPVVGQLLADWLSDDEEECQHKKLKLEAQQQEQGQGAQQQEEQGQQEGQEGQQGHVEVAVTYRPFHSYPMCQAVQEGYVLDVLQQYITITSHLQIASVQQQQEEQQQQQQAEQGGTGAARSDAKVRCQLTALHASRRHMLHCGTADASNQRA